MSRSMNMLRTRRRDNNVKPNRRNARACRLDRKSSRGMIYENEELRLRTININAEIERGQYDIKKLKRENEMLKKEIWCLRDEYDKLDKMLKEKEYDFSSSSTTCSSDSDSCSSCSGESEEVETSQNIQNVQKTNMRNLYSEFDHLSIVPEENSTENSDKNSNTNSLPTDNWNLDNNIIRPDQSYPNFEKSSTLPSLTPKNFFSPIKVTKSCDDKNIYSDEVSLEPHQPYPNVVTPTSEDISTIAKTSTDLIVKTDNHGFSSCANRNTFSNGGNLEELLNDIENISQDILKITNGQTRPEGNQSQKPYKSELNVVLMPNPMPLLGFDRYKNLPNSLESLHSKSVEKVMLPEENINVPTIMRNSDENSFPLGHTSDSNSDFFNTRYNPENFDKPITTLNGSKTNLLELTSSDLISSENEENLKSQATKSESENEKKTPKMNSIRRKVSIHFKGKRDKSLKQNEKKHSLFDIKFGEPKHNKTPSLESKKSTDLETTKTPTSSDCKTGSEKKKNEDKKLRKSLSISPDRKHVHVKDEKKHKKHKKNDRLKARRGTVTSVDRMYRERSFSVCTDRSNPDNKMGGFYDDFAMHSERERTNSLSSCDTIKTTRKMSNISNIPLNGKVPWCACWGNGCI